MGQAELLNIEEPNRKKKKKKKKGSRIEDSPGSFPYSTSHHVPNEFNENQREYQEGASNINAISRPQLQPLRSPRRRRRSGWDSSDDEDFNNNEYSRQSRVVEMMAMRTHATDNDRRQDRPRRIAAPSIGLRGNQQQRSVSYANVRRREPRGSVSV